MAKHANDAGANILYDNRIIYFNGKFNEEKVKDVVQQLFQLELKDSEKDIIMIIDSYGGQIHSFLALYDVIKLLRCDVATVAIGKAMSCGQMLLMSGTKGKRFATKHSRILLHEMEAGTIGKLSGIEADAEEFRELNDILISIITKNSNIKKKEAEAFMANENYMSPKKAKEFGIIDHIIETRSDLYSKVNV